MWGEKGGEGGRGTRQGRTWPEGTGSGARAGWSDPPSPAVRSGPRLPSPVTAIADSDSRHGGRERGCSPASRWPSRRRGHDILVMMLDWQPAPGRAERRLHFALCAPRPAGDAGRRTQRSGTAPGRSERRLHFDLCAPWPAGDAGRRSGTATGRAEHRLHFFRCPPWPAGDAGQRARRSGTAPGMVERRLHFDLCAPRPAGDAGRRAQRSGTASGRSEHRLHFAWCAPWTAGGDAGRRAQRSGTAPGRAEHRLHFARSADDAGRRAQRSRTAPISCVPETSAEVRNRKLCGCEWTQECT